MPIISQETWDNMSQEEKDKIIEYYNIYSNEVENDSEISVANGQKHLLEALFGKKNLQLKSKIRTWDDVEKENEAIKNIYKELESDVLKDLPYKERQLIRKMLAIYQIQQLIELGYGGIVSEEEWCNNQADFIGIYYCPKSKTYEFRVPLLYHFITFRNRKVAEEFMSYPENVKLVQQYYMSI